MIWQSNLSQFQQEVIDDFGGKTTILPTPAEQVAKETQGAVK